MIKGLAFNRQSKGSGGSGTPIHEETSPRGPLIKSSEASEASPRTKRGSPGGSASIGEDTERGRLMATLPDKRKGSILLSEDFKKEGTSTFGTRFKDILKGPGRIKEED